MSLSDLTLITCSYNTLEFTSTMLKSYVYHHSSEGKFNIVVMENSTNEKTRNFLKDKQISFDACPGRTHSISVDLALTKVKTKYALLVDTDIIFYKPIYDIFEQFKESSVAIMGEICGDRGGYRLFPRVFPWFCFINVEKVNEKGIRFHDQQRIDATNSGKFFGNVPLNFDRTGYYYDVGSTFLEDINKFELGVIDKKFDPEYFYHFEGISWYRESQISGYIESYNQKFSELERIKRLYEKVMLKGKFI